MLHENSICDQSWSVDCRERTGWGGRDGEF